MNTRNCYIAIDLGATSGRVIAGFYHDQKWETQVLHRFPNAPVEQVCCGTKHSVWEIDTLFDEIVQGLKKAQQQSLHILSIGVDTWGVDIVFLDKEGKKLANPIAYRDPYTVDSMPYFHQHVLSASKVYALTGIQMMNFNTLYQLFACHQSHYEAFEKAAHYLFIPDYLSYRLTGKMVCEYTILSTSQLLNPATRQIDPTLVMAAGARIEAFPEVVYPGHEIGLLNPSILDLGYPIPVLAVAGHDTASAVASVPRGQIAYLSSGTWSLMGIVSDHPIITPESQQLNFTNEGGVDGTTRVLKNITGMWILERCRQEWKDAGKDYAYTEIDKMAATVLSDSAHCQALTTFNPDEPRFANPPSMLYEVCDHHSYTDAEVIAVIFLSLAKRYGEVFHMLETLAPWRIEQLYIIGGGAKNILLNRLTEQAIGIPVIAGDVEATALGNLMIQHEYHQARG